MKKHLLLTLGLALTSPLLLAQTSGSTDDQKKSATPATPAVPATPATPSSDNTAVEGPTTNEEGDTSGSARSGKNSAGATGNPNTKSAKTRTRSSNANEFGSLDANGDNKISQDELKTSTALGARFGEADANADGSLSRAEFAKMQTTSPTGRDSSGKDVTKQPTTEGSDRTSKDDELNRKLPGQ